MTSKFENDYWVEKLLRKLIAFVVVAALAIPIMAPSAFAAASVGISGGDEVKGGETFTVAVTFSGGDVGRVDAQMTYDTDKLTYISGGTSSGNSGYIQLKSAGTEGAIVFNIKFQAVSEGGTELQVTTNEMYDLDERMLNNPSTAKTVSIIGSASADELIEDEPDEEEPVKDKELLGVDEKTEEEDDGGITTIALIIAAAVLLILIIVIIVVLSRKGKKNKPAPAPSNARIGRSGKPLGYDDDDYIDIDKW